MKLPDNWTASSTKRRGEKNETSWGKTHVHELAPFAFKTAIKNVQAPFLKHLHRYLYQHVNDKLITPRMKKCFIIVYLFLCCFKIIRKIRI